MLGPGGGLTGWQSPPEGQVLGGGGGSGGDVPGNLQVRPSKRGASLPVPCAGGMHNDAAMAVHKQTSGVQLAIPWGRGWRCPEGW